MYTTLIYILIAAAILAPIALGYFGMHSAKKKYVAKHAKATDASTFFTICTSVLGIALCVIALSTLTYAWYVDSVSSTANVIKAGTFKVYMVVDDGSSNIGENVEYNITDTENINIKFNLKGNTKGYAIISLYNTDDADVIKYQTRTLDPSLEADKTAMNSGFDICSYGYTKIKLKYVWGESTITSGDLVCITEDALNTQSTNYINAIMADAETATLAEDIDDLTNTLSSTYKLGKGYAVKMKLSGDIAIEDTIVLGNYSDNAAIADTLYIDLNGHNLLNEKNSGIFYIGSNSKLVLYDTSGKAGSVISINNTVHKKSGAKLYVLNGVSVDVTAETNKIPILEE